MRQKGKIKNRRATGRSPPPCPDSESAVVDDVRIERPKQNQECTSDNIARASSPAVEPAPSAADSPPSCDAGSDAASTTHDLVAHAEEGQLADWEQDIAAIAQAVENMASKRDEKQSLSKTPVGLSALTLASIHHTYAQAHRRHGHRHHDHHDHHDHHGSHKPRGSSLLFTWIVIPLIAAVVWGGYGGTGEVPMARTEVKARLQECNITQGGVYDMFNEMTATEDAGHALLMVQLVRFKARSAARTAGPTMAVAIQDRDVISLKSDGPASIEDLYLQAVWGAAIRRSGHPVYAGSAVGSPFALPAQARVCPCLVPPSKWDVVYVTRWRSLRDAVETMCDVGPTIINERWGRAIEREMAVVVDASALTFVIRFIIVATAAYIMVHKFAHAVIVDDDRRSIHDHPHHLHHRRHHHIHRHTAQPIHHLHTAGPEEVPTLEAELSFFDTPIDDTG